MISTTELSLANAITHGQEIGYRVSFHCENCGHDMFLLEHREEKIGNRNEDIIIERTFYLRCTQCGSEEANHNITIIPSWSGPRIDRDKLPKWECDK
jgi:YgiT-type zinc finger domain-containing protein